MLFQPGSDDQDGLSGKAPFHQLLCYSADVLPGLLKGDMRVNVLCLDQSTQACQVALRRLVLKFLEDVKAMEARPTSNEEGAEIKGHRCSR